MRKTVKIILLITAASLILVSLSSCGFVSWVWGGNRFSPEAAMEAVSLGSSQRQRIETESCYFYYTTVADNYEISANSDMADCISHVTPVTKNSIGMWHAVTDPRSYPVYADKTEAYVGSLVVEKLDGTYHNFFIPFIDGANPQALPAALADGYSTISVNGKTLELFKHSYFTTDATVQNFEINGALFTVDC